MKARNLGLAVMMAVALTACGGGGDGSDGGASAQTSQVKGSAKGQFSVSRPIAPESISVSDTLTLKVNVKFLGKVENVSPFTLPLAVWTDGGPSKTVNVTLDQTAPGIYTGMVGVEMPAQTMGVHTHYVKLRPADAFEFEGMVDEIRYVSVNYTN